MHYIPSFTKRFEVVVAANLGKSLGPPMPKGALIHVSRKTKSRRQNSLFLWLVKLMLWTSKKTCWWFTYRHVDAVAKYIPLYYCFVITNKVCWWLWHDSRTECISCYSWQQNQTFTKLFLPITLNVYLKIYFD